MSLQVIVSCFFIFSCFIFSGVHWIISKSFGWIQSLLYCKFLDPPPTHRNELVFLRFCKTVESLSDWQELLEDLFSFCRGEFSICVWIRFSRRRWLSLSFVGVKNFLSTLDDSNCDCVLNCVTNWLYYYYELIYWLIKIWDGFNIFGWGSVYWKEVEPACAS